MTPNEPSSGISESSPGQLEQIAKRHNLSIDAVRALYRALQAGGGRMAQFNHPDLGGMGQWSGGMTMIGDLSNAALKEKVQSTCAELAAILGTAGSSHSDHTEDGSKALESFAKAGASNASWWPSGLGDAASAGAQNDSQYAYFPSSRRLAIKQGGKVTLFDTADHQIFGVSQQQGRSSTLTFESQHGPIATTDLKKVE
jgi:hypothetical protein